MYVDNEVEIEITRRTEAMMNSYFVFGKLGRSEASFRFKVIVFASCVYGVWLSGVDNVASTSRQTTTLDAAWIKLARGATPQSCKAETEDRTLSNQQVYHLWKLTGFAVELRVKRLGRLQIMRSNLARHEQ